MAIDSGCRAGNCSWPSASRQGACYRPIMLERCNAAPKFDRLRRYFCRETLHFLSRVLI